MFAKKKHLRVKMYVKKLIFFVLRTKVKFETTEKNNKISKKANQLH